MHFKGALCKKLVLEIKFNNRETLFGFEFCVSSKSVLDNKITAVFVIF